MGKLRKKYQNRFEQLRIMLDDVVDSGEATEEEVKIVRDQMIAKFNLLETRIRSSKQGRY